MKESGYKQISISEPTYAGIYSLMAGIECMRTDFEEALVNIKIAYSLSINNPNNSHKVVMLLVYWLITIGRRDNAGMMKLINEIEDIIQQNTISPAAIAIYIGMKGKMLIEQNEPEKARHLFMENGLGSDKKISHLTDRSYISFVLLLITELKFKEAERILSELQTMAKAARRIETLVEVKIMYAILYKQSGNKEKAIVNLIQALEAAACENILMYFIIYQSEISDLLKEVYKIQATTKTNIPKELTDKLKRSIEKREKVNKICFEAGLSQREIDALKLIAEDLTNQEIADKLFISLNTIKTHVKNILLKLEVESRIKAVTKAKELGII
jgi:LuxR family maltose regulon positive regulatory protein